MAQPPDISESFKREVDENLRRDQLRDYFRDYGSWLIAGVVLFLIASGGFIWWRQHQVQQHEAQVEKLAQVYKDKSEADLQAEQNKLIRDALSSGRRVFVALPSSFMVLFRGRLNTSEFQAVSIEKWREPVQMSEEGRRALANLGFGAGLMMGRGVPQNWEIVEVKRKT